jgi:hypothetical protein
MMRSSVASRSFLCNSALQRFSSGTNSVSASDIRGVRPENGVRSVTTLGRIARCVNELLRFRSTKPRPKRAHLGSDPKCVTRALRLPG